MGWCTIGIFFSHPEDSVAAVGRELRMIELKAEIDELCRRQGEPPRYGIDQLEPDRVAGAGPVPTEPGGGGA